MSSWGRLHYNIGMINLFLAVPSISRPSTLALADFTRVVMRISQTDRKAKRVSINKPTDLRSSTSACGSRLALGLRVCGISYGLPHDFTSMSPMKICERSSWVPASMTWEGGGKGGSIT